MLDTPISETAILGLGVGASMAGLKPVVEIMYLDFIGVCLDQLLNQAAKLRFMTGGAVTLPMTVRTQFGSGRSSGSQHSQSLEALLAHIPGLTVVMPSTLADAFGLLRLAIQDPNPVIVIENPHCTETGAPMPPEHTVPVGQAVVRRPGRTDDRVVHHGARFAARRRGARRSGHRGRGDRSATVVPLTGQPCCSRFGAQDACS